MDAPEAMWELSCMAKPKPKPGISAQLPAILARVKPAGMSARQWLIESEVNESFFTDLRNGREPGIDKVERLAKRAGLTLQDIAAGGKAAAPDTRGTAWTPSEQTLSRLMAVALRALPGGRAHADHAQLLAHAISEALKMLAPETGREDDPGFLAALDRRIILVISSHNPPPSQSATHTQRHKSDKP